MVKPRAVISIVVRRLHVFALLVLVSVVLQWRNGAYVAEFGAEGDEASHYVTSLLVRNYLADGMPSNPVSYAEQLYLHYPKIAFGVWPPLFHLSAGIWMWIFGPGRASILVFCAMLAGGCAWLVYLFAERYFGRWAAAVAGLMFLALPATQVLSSQVMTDMLVAMLSLAASLAYGQFLRRESVRDAVLFGVLAAGAILTKYNALALVFVPPLAVLFCGRGRLLRKGVFWLPAAIVALVAGPWYLKMQHLVWYAAQPVPGPADMPMVAGLYLMYAGKLLLWVLAPAMVAGVAEWWTSGERDPMWSAVAAQVAGVLLFHTVIYVFFEQRYLSQAVPGLILFAFKGAVWMAHRAEIIWIRREHLAGASICAAMVPVLLWPGRVMDPHKKHHGYAEIAEQILADTSRPVHRILVSSEARGDSMLVSELALREPKQPRHIVLRAGKVFASSTWMGVDYQLLHTPASAFAYLRETGVTLLVVDRRPRVEAAMPHHAVVVEMVSQFGSGWKKRPEAASGVDVYEVPQEAGVENPTIRLDLRHTLGRQIHN